MSSPPQRPSVTANEPIGADRELALLHTPAQMRPAFEALWALDAAMGDVVARSTEPALAAVKLAWWRERLEELDSGTPPAEPRLQDAARELVPRAISGARLAGLEAGWAALLQPEVDAAAVGERGALLFAIGRELLGGSDERLADAGALYALASVGRRGVPELFEPAGAQLARLSAHRFPRRLRPLTMLARAAARDLSRQEAEGSRARVAAMLAHRWSGRIRG
jgi:phytoene synthase